MRNDDRTVPETGFAQFRRGLRVQGNVIGALMMRELHTRYGRDNVGYLWMFMEPMILAGAVTLMHATQKTHYGSDIQVVPFALLGYSMFIMFRSMVSRAEGTLEANMPLLYHRSVSVFDMMLARALLEGASTFVAFLVLDAAMSTIGLADLPYRPIEFIIGVAFIWWWSYAISMLVCAYTYENNLIGRFVHPAVYLALPTSGAFYQLIWLPEPYRTWLSWFPMSEIFEQLRYGQFESATNEFVSLPYLIGCCLPMTYVGIVAVRRVRREVHLR